MADDGKRKKSKSQIVAIAYLTQEEVWKVGREIAHLYPLPDDRSFDELLAKLDRAIRQSKK